MKYTSIFLAEKLTPFPITQIIPLYMKWPRNHPTSGDLHVRRLTWYHTVRWVFAHPIQKFLKYLSLTCRNIFIVSKQCYIFSLLWHCLPITIYGAANK